MMKSLLLETRGGEVSVEAMDAAEAFLEAEAAGRSGEAAQGIKAATEANVSNHVILYLNSRLCNVLYCIIK
jgi:hypothetical protein